MPKNDSTNHGYVVFLLAFFLLQGAVADEQAVTSESPSDTSVDASQMTRQQHFRSLIDQAKEEEDSPESVFEALKIAVAQKIKKKNQQNRIVSLLTPPSMLVPSNMEAEIINSVFRALQISGISSVKIETHAQLELNQEDFAEACEDLYSDILIQVEVGTRFMTLYLYDVRESESIYFFRQQIPDPRFNHYTAEAWGFFSQPAVKYLMYSYIQGRTQPLPSTGRKTRKNQGPREASSRVYSDWGAGWTMATGENKASLSHMSLNLDLGYLISPQFAFEISMLHFGYTGLGGSLRYQSSSRRSTWRWQAGLGGLQVFQRYPWENVENGMPFDPDAGLNLGGFYLWGKFGVDFKIDEIAWVGVEAYYLKGGATSAMGGLLHVTTQF